MKVSYDGQIMAVLLGRKMQKDEYKIENINFYEIKHVVDEVWNYKLKYARDLTLEGNDISI